MKEKKILTWYLLPIIQKVGRRKKERPHRKYTALTATWTYTVGTVYIYTTLNSINTWMYTLLLTTRGHTTGVDRHYEKDTTTGLARCRWTEWRRSWHKYLALPDRHAMNVSTTTKTKMGAASRRTRTSRVFSQQKKEKKNTALWN